MAKRAMDVANRMALDLDIAIVDSVVDLLYTTSLEYVATEIQGLVRGLVNIG